MEQKNKRRSLEGIVVSDKMNKTISVAVVRRKHPLVGKYVKRTTKVMAHDEKNEAKKGDKVVVKEIRPMSKRKRWILTKIDKKAAGQEIIIDDGSDK